MKAAFSIAITPLSKNAGDDKYRTTHKKLDRMKKQTFTKQSQTIFKQQWRKGSNTQNSNFLETYTHICVGKTYLFTFCVLHYLAGNNS